jgi:hypothetical protein
MRARVIAAVLGLFAVVAAHAPAQAMSFGLVRLNLEDCRPECPFVVVAQGEIGINSAEQFIAFMRQAVQGRKLSQMVLIGSPGGNLLGSLKLGVTIRQLGMSVMVGQPRGSTFVSARCYSACVYALMGGKSRVVPEGSVVGVHRPAQRFVGQRDIVGEGTIDARVPTGEILNVLNRYARQMGVSERLNALAEDTPHESIRVLTADELRAMRVTTGSGKARKRRAS